MNTLKNNFHPISSVVMPVYNSEKYLCQSIESILKQTLKDFEFIIVNDGSNDGSLSIIKYYENKDRRIRLINLATNQGIANALNIGIQYAKGKYIVRMDSDDISLKHRLEVQVQYMENNSDCDICGSWVEVFDENRVITQWEVPETHDEILCEMLFRSAIFHPTVIMRKAILENRFDIYNKNFVPAEDYELWQRLSTTAIFHNIPEVLLRYRQHNLGTSMLQMTRQAELSNIIRLQLTKKIKMDFKKEQERIYLAFANRDKLYLLEHKQQAKCFLNALRQNDQFITKAIINNKVEELEYYLNKVDSQYILFIMAKCTFVSKLIDFDKIDPFIRRLYRDHVKKY